MTCKGIIRGRIIEVDKPLPFADGQAVLLEVEPDQTQGPDGSPASVLRAIQSLPPLAAEDVEELTRSINEGRMPVRFSGIFDDQA